MTAYSSIKRLGPKPGSWLVISGAAGALGHLGIQYAKSLGLKVVAIDGGSPEKEALCREVGADVYIDFMKTETGVVETVRTVTGGGADYVLALSPHQTAYNDAGEYARFGARIMAVGIGSCHMPLRPLLQKALTVYSNQTGTKDDMQEALKMTVDGKVKCRVEVMKLENLNLALDRVKGGRVLGKLVVDLRR